MKYLKIFFQDVLKKPSLYFFVFLVVFSVDRHHRYESYVDVRYGPFYGDVLEYYTFLPEYFLDYKQVDGINFETNKRTVGMAIMYAPAFLIGHTIARFTGENRLGYSWPYQWAVRWGSILYCFLGLIFCRKNLLRFFKEPVVTLALFCVFFGTNLFYYTFAAGEFPHGYLFFLYSLFIYFTFKWILEKKHNFLLLLGLTAGMITLIRPTGLIILLFPLLFKISSFKDFTERLKYIFTGKISFFLALLLFMLPLIFQMLIWKHFKGEYICYSYGKERFFFNDPQVINFLFSFRKGWLIYTPIMTFSIIGMFLARKRLREFFPFIIIFFLLNVYILSSWWDWAYGGSFGCRVLIESYAFMIFPLAVFISLCWEFNWDKKIIKNSARILLVTLLYLLIRLNLFQIWQYRYGIIHWGGMNRETYKFVFLRDNFSAQDIKYLKTKWMTPEPEKMLIGFRDE